MVSCSATVRNTPEEIKGVSRFDLAAELHSLVEKYLNSNPLLHDVPTLLDRMRFLISAMETYHYEIRAHEMMHGSDSRKFGNHRINDDPLWCGSALESFFNDYGDYFTEAKEKQVMKYLALAGDKNPGGYSENVAKNIYLLMNRVAKSAASIATKIKPLSGVK